MARRNALEALVGSMTIAELASRSGKSVEDIVDWAMSGIATSSEAGKASRSSSSNSGSGRASASSAVNTRTKEGRVAYDEAVLDSVRESSNPIGASALRSQVGGTPLQVRASLDRLIESGAVTYEGRARATRYSAP